MSRLLHLARRIINGGYGLLYNWYATQEQIASIEYGYLYNWYAATGRTFVAGWHLPTKTEFDSLSTYLGGNGVSGGHLKETGTTHWLTPNTGADNSVGFNARGASTRDISGVYGLPNNAETLYLTASTTGVYCYVFRCAYDNTLGYTTAGEKKLGCSIRLIKDSTTLTDGQTGTVTIDGKVYNTICIGTQEWMAENLMAKNYADGTPTPEVTDNTAWAALTTGARCSYANTESNAGSTTKITSSDDWSFSYSDWRTLFEYLGITFDVDGFSIEMPNNLYEKLQEEGSVHWDSPYNIGLNEYNFTAVGSGVRSYDTGEFLDLKITSSYFSQTEYAIDNYWAWTVNINGDENSINNNQKTYGLSLRLSRLATSPELLLADGTYVDDYVGNDLTEYKCVKIGTQIWLAESLKETKYRDGSWIHGFDGGTYTPITDEDWAELVTAAVCVYGDNLSNI